MFEEFYVNYALQLAKSMGMTQLDFAMAVWPDVTKETANTKIICVKGKNSRGKRQNLLLADAVSMAQAVGREYPSFCFEVWEKLRISLKETGGSLALPPKRKSAGTAPQGTDAPSSDFIDAVAGD